MNSPPPIADTPPASPLEIRRGKPSPVVTQATVMRDARSLALSPHVKTSWVDVELCKAQLLEGNRTKKRTAEVYDVVTGDALNCPPVVVDVEQAEMIDAMQQLAQNKPPMFFTVKVRRHVRQEQLENSLDALIHEWNFCSYIFDMQHNAACYKVPFTQLLPPCDDIFQCMTRSAEKLLQAGVISPTMCAFEGHINTSGRVAVKDASFLVEAVREVNKIRFALDKPLYEEYIFIYPCRTCRLHNTPCQWAYDHFIWRKGSFDDHYMLQSVPAKDAAQLLTITHYAEQLDMLQKEKRRRSKIIGRLHYTPSGKEEPVEGLDEEKADSGGEEGGSEEKREEGADTEEEKDEVEEEL